MPSRMRVDPEEADDHWKTAPNLAVRRRQPELMDDPALDLELHREALGALRRINRVSLASRRVWREVRALRGRAGRVPIVHRAVEGEGSESGPLDEPIRILDVACGGGDILVDVGRRARRAGIAVTLEACDVSPVARAETHRACSQADLMVRVFDADVVEGDLVGTADAGVYDLVTTSLFLHHLDRDQGVRLLRKMARATRRTLLVQDLRRSRLGYAFAWVGLHALTRSSVARVDGLRSVRASLRTEEVREMCAEAGLTGATVEQVWPQRFVVVWRRR